jgi:hypothetical protein
MYLYAIGVDKHFVQFGVGRTPLSRIGSMQDDLPVIISVLGKLKVYSRPKGEDIQHLLMSAMQPYHLRGDWFKWSARIENAVRAMNTDTPQMFSAKVERWLTSLEFDSSATLAAVVPERRRFQ